MWVRLCLDWAWGVGHALRGPAFRLTFSLGVYLYLCICLSLSLSPSLPLSLLPSLPLWNCKSRCWLQSPLQPRLVFEVEAEASAPLRPSGCKGAWLCGPSSGMEELGCGGEGGRSQGGWLLLLLGLGGLRFGCGFGGRRFLAGLAPSALAGVWALALAFVRSRPEARVYP